MGPESRRHSSRCFARLIRPNIVGTAPAGDRAMMLVPVKSRDGTSTAPRPGAIALKTSSMSPEVTIGMSESTVHNSEAPEALSASVARPTAAFNPRGYSSSMHIAPASRASPSKPGSEVTTAMRSASCEPVEAASTSRNIASAKIRRSGSGRTDASRVLANERCFAAIRINRTRSLYRTLKRLANGRRKGRAADGQHRNLCLNCDGIRNRQTT